MSKHVYLLRFFCWVFLAFSVALSSCSDDNTGPIVPPSSQDGYFIVNEGGFGNANASLSYYDRANDSVINNVFETVNGRPLGDQAQSMTVFDERGFIIVQNSAKIEVINRDDFTSIATITEGIISPRYLIGVDDTKAYVTDWGADGISGTVKVIDLATYEVTKTIPVGQGPNGLVLLNNQVYVANNGSVGYDSTVMVLDAQTDVVTDTIVVGDNPKSVAIDANNNVWITGSGRLAYVDGAPDLTQSTPGFVARLEADTVAFKVEVDQATYSEFKLAMDDSGEQLYFLYGEGVYRLGINDTNLPDTPFVTGNFYGLAIDPVNGEILTGDPLNYTSEGTFFRYSPAGQLIKSYTVGIAPNGFAF